MVDGIQGQIVIQARCGCIRQCVVGIHGSTSSCSFRLGNGISYRPYERRLKSRRDQADTYAGFEFHFGEATIQSTVFPVDGIRQAPISPVDGKPMKRADESAVRSLLA